ncbi:MAG TPA: SDR family oxidoreductase [Ktedonobacteraceae bacterium]|nr:SDR family oxidoreductase [Ktedonobacteraceae bacterium]
MKLLLLGGTVFLGRHIVEAALARGHEVTLFNRGQHNPDLFPGVEKLRGDRNGDLAALQGRQWDAAIDTSGFVPRVVRASAEALTNAIKHYTFISSISVYADFTKPGIDERFPVAKLADESVEEVTGETYGGLKALCEQAAEEVLPGKVLIVRPGLIVGPDDQSDRFTYWPYRVAQGGEMLAPGKPAHQEQFIDVRDLAQWIVRMVEAGKTGVYNATGPDYVLSTQQLLEECKAATGSDAQFTWVDEAFLDSILEEVRLQPWVPDAYMGMRAVNCNKAFADGLTFRPLAETVRDTLAWKADSPAADTLRSGLKPEQEQQLLQAWHKREK